MARTPLSEAERVARRLSKELSDIANKMDKLGEKQIEPIKLPSFDKFEDETAKIQRKFNALALVSSQYRKNLKDIDDAHKRAAGGIKRYTQHIEETANQHKKLKKELEELEEKVGDLTKADQKQIKALNEKKEALKGLEVAQGNYQRQLKKYSDWKERIEKFDKSGAAAKHALGEKIPAMIGKVGGKFLKFGMAAMAETLTQITSGIDAVYDLQNKFRGAFAGMAQAVGPTTLSLQNLQKAATDAYFEKGGLGELGMTIEQISQAFGEMAGAAEYSDLVTGNNVQTMLKYARSIGLTSQEAGGLVKQFAFMGEGTDELEYRMGQVNAMARKLGINTNVLAKEVFVAGKNLLAMAGPKFQNEMISAIAKMKSMGMSAQELEKFTDMTDSIEGVTTSMAKMNTVFGTHIDILRVFAEQDPSKRMQIILDQMTAQGIRLDTMDRIHRKFMAESLGVSLDTVNAMAKAAQEGKDYTKVLEQQEQASIDLDNAQRELRTTMANIVRFFDKITVAVGKALTPLLNKLNLNGALGRNIQSFQDLLDALGDKIGVFFEKLSNNPKFQHAMDRLAGVIERIFNLLGDDQFISRVADMISSIVEGVSRWVDGFEKIGEFFATGWIGGALMKIVGAVGSVAMEIGGILASVFGIFKVVRWIKNIPGLFGGGGGGGGAAAGAAASTKAASSAAKGAQMVLPGMEEAAGVAGSKILPKALGIAGKVAGGAGVAYALLDPDITGEYKGPNLMAMARQQFGDNIPADVLKKIAEGDFEIKDDQLVMRAVGGRTAAGVPYTVGEAGKETFIPDQNGTIVPNNGAMVHVQVFLDNEMIQDRMYKSNLRNPY